MVPKGTYRYGLATPLACTRYPTGEMENCSGKLPLFAEVTVATDPPTDCASPLGDAGATVTTTIPPWQASDGGAAATETCPVPDAGAPAIDPGLGNAGMCASVAGTAPPSNASPSALGLGLLASAAALRRRIRQR